MQLTHEIQNGIAILALVGRLDTRGAPELESHGRALFRDGARKLLVDMAGVDYISSAGLRVLLVLAKEADGCAGTLSVCCLTPAVLEVMTVSGFDTIIPLADDRQSALDALQSPPA
ncbi:MAG: STAS domain-containing protein [Lentisphaerae bacterium]|nr:STAS domain-containing protein [Lentisphaerota bacterium]